MPVYYHATRCVYAFIELIFADKSPFTEVNLRAVRLAVLREEQEEMQQRGLVLDHSPASFISLGLDVEQYQ